MRNAPATQAPPRPRTVEQVVAELHAQLEIKRQSSDVTGAALAIIANGKLFCDGFGTRSRAELEPVTCDTAFRIGSVTKVITGMALLQLRDNGRLDLDDRLDKWIPESSGLLYPSDDHPPVRLRNLVTHTSGLPQDFGARSTANRSALLRSLAGLQLAATPGTVDIYSNGAMALAGIVVDRASGEPYEEYVERHILAPLGMHSTGFSDYSGSSHEVAVGYSHGRAVGPRANLDAYNSVGGLYSTARDLSRLAAFELSAWPARTEPERGPLNRASARESQLPAGPGLGDGESRGAVGVNWLLRGEDGYGEFVWHDGGVAGFSSVVAMLPRFGIAIIVLVNDEVDWQRRFAEAALRLLADVSEPRKQEPAPGQRRVAERLLAFFSDSGGAPVPWKDVAESSLLPYITSADFTEKLDWLRRRMGKCAGYDVLSLRDGTLKFRCEGGTFRVAVTTEPHEPDRLQWIKIYTEDVRPSLSGALAARLTELGQWLETEEPKLLRQLFAPTITANGGAERLHQTAATARRVHGRCHGELARAIAEDERSTLVELPCAKGFWRFNMSLAKSSDEQIVSWWWQ